MALWHHQPSSGTTGTIDYMGLLEGAGGPKRGPRDFRVLGIAECCEEKLPAHGEPSHGVVLSPAGCPTAHRQTHLIDISTLRLPAGAGDQQASGKVATLETTWKTAFPLICILSNTEEGTALMSGEQSEISIDCFQMENMNPSI